MGGDERHDLVDGRHPHPAERRCEPASRVERAQVVERRGGHRPRAIGGAIERVVVDADERAVAAASDVELEAEVRVEAGLETGQRVLRRVAEQSAVGHGDDVGGRLAEEPREEGDDLRVRFGCRGMRLSVGHRDPLVHAEQLVHGDRVVERRPARGRILGATGDEEGTRRHERVELVEIVAAGDELGIGARARIVRGHEPGLAGAAGVQAEVPRLLVVDAPASLVEHDARIAPCRAGVAVVETGSEEGPLTSVGMPHDADPSRIDVVPGGEGRMAVGRDEPEVGQRLAHGSGAVRQTGVATRRPDGQAHEAVPRQLEREITVFAAQADARLGLVVRHEDRGKRPRAVGHEQVAVENLLGCHLHAYPMLREGFTVLGCDDLQSWRRDERRPGAEQRVPRVADFPPPLRPFERVRDATAVAEQQGRTEARERAGERGWRAKERREIDRRAVIRPGRGRRTRPGGPVGAGLPGLSMSALSQPASPVQPWFHLPRPANVQGPIVVVAVPLG